MDSLIILFQFSLFLIFVIYLLTTEIVRKEVVHIKYENSSMHVLLEDKCSTAELKWLLAALDVYGNDKTGYTPNMNRTLLTAEILKIQVARFEQWEFGKDEKRTIKPFVDLICNQNYSIVRDELSNKCTLSELYKIVDHMGIVKSYEKDNKLDLSEDIVKVKRENDLLNTTYLVDKFCVERKLNELKLELTASCSPKRIKALYTELTDKNFHDMSCYQCIDKMEFIEAVVEVKRHYYDEVRILSMMRKFCVEPELEFLAQKMVKRCRGGEVKKIFEGLSTDGAPMCLEKAECIEAIIEMKRNRFKETEINSLIHKFCSRHEL